MKNPSSSKKASKSSKATEDYANKMTSDRFVALMLSNLETARDFLQFILPEKVSTQLDFETLKCDRPRINSERGEEQIADFVFSVKVKESIAPEGRFENFVIILEHKSNDDPGVAFQVASYEIALLRKMWQNRGTTSKNVKIPAPYPIVFSQDWSDSDPQSLKAHLTTLPGLEDMLPDVKFFVYKICLATIEEIAKCKPLTALFLCLLRIAYKKKSEPDKESKELALILEKCCAKLNPDEQFMSDVRACYVYWNKILKQRPKTPTAEMVRTKMNATSLILDESTVFKMTFPKYYAEQQKANRKALREVIRQVTKEAKQEAKQEANQKVKEAKQEANQKVKEAKQEAKEAKQEVSQRVLFYTEKLKQRLLKDIDARFPNEQHTTLNALIAEVDNYDDVDFIYDLCRDSASIEEMTEKVQRYVKSKS